MDIMTKSKIDEHKTGFLDLPAEIRNTIYHRALRVDGRVTIEKCRHRLLMRSPDESDTVLEVSIAILRTSKRIDFEATPVFYGNNAFRFSHSTVFNEFTTQIGRAIQNLRNVQIDHVEIKLSFTAGLNRLRKSKTLEKLALDFSMRSLYSPKQLATKLGPMLKGVKKARELSGDTASVEDVIEFCRIYDTDPEEDEVKAYADEFRSELRRKLLK